MLRLGSSSEAPAFTPGAVMKFATGGDNGVPVTGNRIGVQTAAPADGTAEQRGAICSLGPSRLGGGMRGVESHGTGIPVCGDNSLCPFSPLCHYSLYKITNL